MRCITYAGETVITSDDVAEVLVDLTAALARDGQAAAAAIPIVTEDDPEGEPQTAELVIGVGNDVLSVPVAWDHPEREFPEDVARLRGHLDSLTRRPEVVPPRLRAVDDEQWDFDTHG